MRFLSAAEIIKLNKRMIILYGGLRTAGDNVANRGSLDYLVEAVPAVIYGQERYVGIFEKAAAYAFFIIKDHIFHDGNKRTGIQAAIVFLESNNHPIVNVTPQEIVDVALKIATEETSRDDLVKWFEKICDQ